MKLIFLLLLALSSPVSAQWIETPGGIGVAISPGSGDVTLVRVQTPRNGGKDRNYDIWPENKWHTIDATDIGVPEDALGLCILGRGQISKGIQHRAAGMDIYIKAMGVPGTPALTWKVRSTAGANGIRENAYACVALTAGKFQFRWQTYGWCPRCSSKRSGQGAITLRANVYFR